MNKEFKGKTLSTLIFIKNGEWSTYLWLAGRIISKNIFSENDMSFFKFHLSRWMIYNELKKGFLSFLRVCCQ
jgi:hypothetical protein